MAAVASKPARVVSRPPGSFAQTVAAVGRNRTAASTVGLVALVTAVGMVLSLQGWKTHAPAFDMLTYFLGVDAFVEHGAILAYGDISSYGSFSPPGTFWLMLPGRLLLTDPRLFEKVGSGILYFGTLLGILMLARATFGVWCAVLAVVLYGFSGLGLAFAGSLWPIGHPFFYVWTALLAIGSAARKDSRFLSAALTTWAVGMYVDLSIAPAGLLIPAIWLLSRPPVMSKTLILGAAVVLAVWFPYLSFEAQRGFVDLQSLLLLRDINPVQYQLAWCDPSLSMQTLATDRNTTVAQPPTAPAQDLTLSGRVDRRARAVVDGLLATFGEAVRVPGGAPVVLLITLGSMVVAWASRSERARHLVISLAVPWAILALVAEPGKTERFLWLWPLQVIFVAAGVTYVMARLNAPRKVAWGLQLVLVLLLVADPVQVRINEWLRSGWDGPDAEEVLVVDYAATQLRADAKEVAAIGYETFVYPFMARYHAIDPHYKVGAEFDLLFRYRYGIVNLDTCAEGVSPADDYRIVQERPEVAPGPPIQFFNVPSDGSFRQFGGVASYSLLRRE